MEILSLPEKIGQILDIVTIPERSSVLDLGTGTGVLLPHIVRRIGSEGHVTAVDLSDGMLAFAIKKCKNLLPPVKFIKADFETDEIPGLFDRIFLYCVYPHLEKPVATLKHLVDNNLSPNGKIVVAFPCDEKFINHVHNEKKPDSDKLLPAPVLSEELRRHGLKANVRCYSEEMYIIEITK